MEVTFYGVRGSCPCAGDRYRRVGGNTACVGLSGPGETPLVLDLGTGLRDLGDVLCQSRSSRPLQASALLTHLHFDHILGLPFFRPLLDPDATLTVYGPPQEGCSLEDALASVLQPPFFPIPIAELPGKLDIRHLDLDGDELAIGSSTVHAARVPHPGRTLGFRVEAQGKSVAYLPDHQAPTDLRSVDEHVRALCEGVDLLVHDAQYTDEEFSAKATWGHSTVAYAVHVAAECRARRLLLFHHDPTHGDREVGMLLRQARRVPAARRVDDVSVAVEGLTVTL